MKHEGVIVTMPLRFFREYPGGFDRFLSIMRSLNHPASNIVWNQTISAKPKQEVQFCYLCVAGEVRYRLDIDGYEEGDKAFVDYCPDGSQVIREHRNKKWVRLRGPFVEAPSPIPMKGFQGFRYCEYLF